MGIFLVMVVLNAAIIATCVLIVTVRLRRCTEFGFSNDDHGCTLSAGLMVKNA